MHYLIITASFLLFGFTAFQALRYIDYKVMQREVDIFEEVGYCVHTNCRHCRRHVTVEPMRNSLTNFKCTCTYCKNKVTVSNLDQYIGRDDKYDIRSV